MESPIAEAPIETLPSRSLRKPVPWDRSPANFWRQSVVGLFLIYLILLLFEGALRKWILPGLSTPLLLVRDPVMVLLLFTAWRGQLLPFNFWTVSLILLALVSMAAGLFILPDNPLIVAYGLRTDFAHLLIIFVVARSLTHREVIWIGKWILLLAVPIAAIMVLQFLSPAGARINSGSSDEFEQMRGALGRIRPQATFSFTTGSAEFLTLTAAFVIHGLMRTRVYGAWLVGLGAAALLVGLAVSVSRTALFSVGLVAIAGGTVSLFRPRDALNLYYAAIVCAVIAAGVLITPLGRDAVLTFAGRFEEAQTVEGSSGMFTRVLALYLEPLAQIPTIPPLGYGIGFGTNVGAKLATGSVGFTLGEGEWFRVLLEMGPYLGGAFLLWRAGLALACLLWSFRAALAGNILPFILAAAAPLLLLQGQLGRPTTLGFVVVTTGLCLAALNRPGSSTLEVGSA